MPAKDAGRHRCVGLKTEQCHYNDAAVDFICSVLIQSVFCLFCPWFVHCNDIKDSVCHELFMTCFCFTSLLFPSPPFVQSLKLFLLNNYQAVSRGLDIWMTIFFFVHNLAQTATLNLQNMSHPNHKLCNHSHKPRQYSTLLLKVLQFNKLSSHFETFISNMCLISSAVSG